MKAFRFALVMVALFAVVALIGSPACAGPFNRCPVIVQTCPTCTLPTWPAGAAQTAAAVEAPQAAGERCLVPFNCPNRQPRPPREEVNVTVTAQHCDPPCQPPCVSLPPQPAEEHPFPTGLLFAVVSIVVVLSSIAAFFIRVGSAGSR